MRKAQTTWLEIGGVFIEIKPGFRDDVPALLSGLQHLQVTAELRGRVFALLKTEVRPEVCRDSGRPGMNDSFCVETDIHYPTDPGLVWDAMRCTVR